MGGISTGESLAEAQNETQITFRTWGRDGLQAPTRAPRMRSP
jgi:hypothetical protein